MSKTRRCLANFSFYDQRGIEKKLEQNIKENGKEVG